MFLFIFIFIVFTLNITNQEQSQKLADAQSATNQALDQQRLEFEQELFILQKTFDVEWFPPPDWL